MTVQSPRLSVAAAHLAVREVTRAVPARSSAVPAGARSPWQRTRTLARFATAVLAGAAAGAALAGPAVASSIEGPPATVKAGGLCDPATKLATPWDPESVPLVPLPEITELPGDEGPHIGTAISIHHGPDVQVRPLRARPAQVERTARLGFRYKAQGAERLRAWVVMAQPVAAVAYPYLAVSDPVKLGARTVKHPRAKGGTIRVPLSREAAYGVGPFLKVQLTLCVAATAANGNLTLIERTAELSA